MGIVRNPLDRYYRLPRAMRSQQEALMTHDDASRWLTAYIDAWRSYDAAAIGALFSDDAESRYHPWDEPVQGREAIVEDWLADRDEPGTWDAEYAPWAIEGNRLVATG